MFLHDFEVHWGCHWEPLWKLFLVFGGMLFNGISNMVPDWVFTVLRRFSNPLDIVLVTFWWSLAPAKTMLPHARKLCFECFEASETDIFLASLFKALLETI